jgi:hypothetical protein
MKFLNFRFQDLLRHIATQSYLTTDHMTRKFTAALVMSQMISNVTLADDLHQESDAGSLPRRSETTIVEEWTAYILPPKQISVGSVAEVGLGQGFTAGIDPASLAIGARSLQVKWQIPKFGEDDWAVGVKYVQLARKYLWLDDMSQHFKSLEAKVIRPSVSWSNRVSKQLVIHSFWASGIGQTRAELSDYGLSELTRKKADADHPDRGYEIASKTMQFQSLAGLTEDRFQVSAEWERRSGEKILLSTRMERTRLGSLETFSTRVTLAQHWAADGLHLRLGAGPQYSILSGQDLDKKEINTTRWLPAADLAVYWIY